MMDRRQIERPGRMEYLDELVEIVVAAATDAGATASIRHDLRLAVEEACINVIRHGYGPRRAGPIGVTVTVEPDEIVVQILDRAPPFAPQDAPPPDLSASWERRRVGGLGWHLIRSVVDRVEYREVEPEGNLLTLAKRLRPAANGEHQ